jgi:ABC-type transporter MlaC component
MIIKRIRKRVESFYPDKLVSYQGSKLKAEGSKQQNKKGDRAENSRLKV